MLTGPLERCLPKLMGRPMDSILTVALMEELMEGKVDGILARDQIRSSTWDVQSKLLKCTFFRLFTTADNGGCDPYCEDASHHWGFRCTRRSRVRSV